MRFHFLLDTSESMGLPATEAGRLRMRELTAAVAPFACEFACHVVDPMYGSPTETNLALARREAIPLRLDVAKDGVERFINLAESAGASYQFSLSSISSDFRQITPMTANGRNIVADMRTVDVGYSQGGNYANTLYEATFPAADHYINQIASADAMDTVVIITDGVRSVRYPTSQSIDMISTEMCDHLKEEGRRVAVIYTEYGNVQNKDYDQYIKPRLPEIEKQMRSCATDNMFAKGSAPGEIIAAFEGLFTKSKSNVLRLTN